LTDTARQRLEVIRNSNDGFAIAERDLQIRGPGEFLGERQSGQRVLRYADFADVDLVRQAREAAEAMPEEAARAHVERWYGSKRDLLDA
jgi:ATP-dependent DNA helicase RecG